MIAAAILKGVVGHALGQRRLIAGSCRVSDTAEPNRRVEKHDIRIRKGRVDVIGLCVVLYLISQRSPTQKQQPGMLQRGTSVWASSLTPSTSIGTLGLAMDPSPADDGPVPPSLRDPLNFDSAMTDQVDSMRWRRLGDQNKAGETLRGRTGMEWVQLDSGWPVVAATKGERRSRPASLIGLHPTPHAAFEPCTKGTFVRCPQEAWTHDECPCPCTTTGRQLGREQISCETSHSRVRTHCSTRDVFGPADLRRLVEGVAKISVQGQGQDL